MEYGYVRVSSKDQNIARQMAAMYEVGIDDKHIYIDKFSGKDFKRPHYKRMVKKLKAGDLLYIKSIDRLGRNYDEIIEQWRTLTKEKHISIVVLDMPLLDTRKDQDLIGTLISDIVLQLLSYVAQTEREFISQRQMEGIEAAKRRGKKFGRPEKEMPEEFEEICRRCEQGELSTRQAAELLGVSHTTFYRRYRKITDKTVSKGRRFDTSE